MSDLSAFIQFIGALYLSLAIDSAFFKRFWNPDFFNMMSSNIMRYTKDKGVNISSVLKNKLIKTTKGKTDQIDTFSRKQGSMMLIYSVALLIAIGFKNHFTGDYSKTASSCLLVFLFFGVISFLTSSFCLKRWRGVFITSAIVLLLPFVMFVPWIKMPFTLGVIWIKIILVAFLLVPIFWRIFYNWLYSKVYSKFIYAKLSEEYKTYVETKELLKAKQLKNIDQRYNQVLKDYFQDSKNFDSDNSCAEVYVDIIAERCNAIPGIVELFKNRNIKVEVDETTESEEGKTEETVKPLSPKNDIFAEMCAKYKQSTTGTSLKTFCNKNNLDFEQFKDYRKQWLKLNP